MNDDQPQEQAPPTDLPESLPERLPEPPTLNASDAPESDAPAEEPPTVLASDAPESAAPAEEPPAVEASGAPESIAPDGEPTADSSVDAEPSDAPPPTRARRQLRPRSAFGWTDVGLLVLLAGLVALFFWRILTPNPADRAQFPVGDFTDQFYAFRLYEARALAEERIPLWSENFNSGHPFLADIQSAVFYPIGFVNTFLNVGLFGEFSLFALELEALLHFWLAGAFLYLFARRVLLRAGWGDAARAAQAAAEYAEPILADAPPPQERGAEHVPFVRLAAFVAAIVFVFGGYLTSYPSLQLAILETAAWLPLALFFLDRATDASARHRAGGGKRSFIAAGIVLGIAALAGHPQTFLFVAAVSISYYVFRRWENRVPGESFALRAAASAALLFLIALGVAAVELVPAIEYQQLSTREALAFADAASGLPTLDLLQFILPGYASAFASPLYVGILPLWLALFALLRRGRERIFWGVLALAALVLAFGFYVFAYVVLYLFVPGASLFRQQERLAFVVSFSLAMLAGYGMLDLMNRLNRQRARALYVILPAGAILMLAMLLVFFTAGAFASQGRLDFLGDRAGLMLLQFALASLLVGLYLRGVLPARLFGALAVVLILFDLWSVGEPANKVPVQNRFADVPFAQELQSDTDTFRVAAADRLLPGHFGIALGLEDIGGISPLRLARYDAFLHLPPQVYLPALDVKYLVTRTPDDAVGSIADRADDLYLVGVYGAPSRAWFVASAQVEPDDTAAATLLSGDLSLKELAVLASPPPFYPDPRSASGTVTVTAHSPERLALEATTPADGLLVVSENDYPGWRAAVDGEPTDILRADLTLRAVPVRAGKHEIVMWYEPTSFKLGIAISAITLALCLGALAYLSRPRGTD